MPNAIFKTLHPSWRWLLSLGLALASVQARADTVTVAVASNFAAPMQALSLAFERTTGHQAVAAFGSTGRFHAQIQNGAPYQVLMAADAETPARLEVEGLAVRGTQMTYAVGRLVLWSATPGRVDAQGTVLRQGNFDRLAIADPRLAPYGAAALDVITGMGLAATLKPKLVQGESVGQAYQFVASGNAQLGFVALSQVQSGGVMGPGSVWRVPPDLHRPLRQNAVLLQAGKNRPAARAFLTFLRSDAARSVIESHGYALEAKP